VKQGSVAGLLADFALMLVAIFVLDLLFRFGLQFRSWDLEQTRINYNTLLAAALALVWFVRKRFF
jgi:hypothetical protein